jgi:hypothetical protein
VNTFYLPEPFYVSSHELFAGGTLPSDMINDGVVLEAIGSAFITSHTGANLR